MVQCLAVVVLTGCAVAQPLSLAADRVVVENDRLSVTFSRAEKGNVVSLVDKRTGRDLSAPTGQRRLFTLVLSERADHSGHQLYVNNTDAIHADFAKRTTAGLTTLTATFHDLAGRGIDCAIEVTARPSDPCLRWRMTSVHLPPTLVLEAAQFPIVLLRAPLGDTDDAAVLGQTKGGVYRKPSAWKPDVSISSAQPGQLAAQFACYYDPRGGMYSACEDPRGYPKSTWMRRTSDGLEIAWSQSCFATDSFAMDYPVAMTTFASADPATPADWRDAADIYKAWALKQPWCARRCLDRKDIPAWLKAGPAMVRFYRNWLAQPEMIERWTRDYWLRRFPAHMPLIVAYWGWEKVESWVTPDYFPAYPSDEVFRRVVKENRAAGGHVFLWPSGYHYTLTYGARADGTFAWDDRARFARDAESHAAVQRDGTTWRVKPSWLDGGEMAAMCPGDPWTIDWLDRTAENCVRRGAEIVQIDQVVGGGFLPCWSTTHGHPLGPGLWQADTFHQQLSTMLARCRKIDPGAVVCFEEPNEHFLQQIAVQDYRDLESPWGGPPPERASVFNYLYHEFVPTFQSNPRAGDKRGEAYCLVNGEIPHLVPDAVAGPGPLLSNGDFEQWSGDVPAGWDKVGGWQGEVWSGSCARDETEAHGGKASLCLGPLKDGETVQVSRNLNVGGSFAPGGTYRFSAWIRTRGVAKPNSIMLGVFTAEWKGVGQTSGLRMPAEQEGWTRVESTFDLEPGAALLRIMLHLAGQGTAWIDDVKLEQVMPDGRAVEIARPEVPPDHALMHRWVELYAGEGRAYLEHGRMLHPPKLEVTGAAGPEDGMPAVLHNAFRAADGSEAVVLVNATDAPQSVRLTWHNKRQSLNLQPWEVHLLK